LLTVVGEVIAVSGEVVLNGVVQGLLLLAALLAWPVTWLLLRRYRRQVVPGDAAHY
jgi:drug/metabolite transporter (DMT)-like permease